MKIFKNPIAGFILLYFILILSLPMRLQHIDYPLLNWHNFRQTQTATVTRNMMNQGIDLFRPRLDILGIGDESILVQEFPLYQASVAVISGITGNMEKAGKVLSILCGIAGAIILYLFVSMLLSDRLIGVLSVFFFLFSQVNVFFHQSFMIEPMVIMFHILSLFIFLRYLQTHKYLYLLLSTAITSFAFIQKNIYAPLLLIELLGLLIFFKKNSLQLKKGIIALFVPLIIALIWQVYSEITNISHHSVYSSFSGNQVEGYIGSIGERFELTVLKDHARLMMFSLNPISIPFLLIGTIFLFLRKNRINYFLLWSFFGICFYYLIFFHAQLHAYRHMIFIPVLSVVFALGIYSSAKFLRSLVILNFNGSSLKDYLLAALLAVYFAAFIYQSNSSYKEGFFIHGYSYKIVSGINSVLKDTGYVILVFPGIDFSSVYTYYTGRKGISYPLKDLDKGKIDLHREQGYRYAVFSEIEVLNKNPKYEELVGQMKRRLGEFNGFMEIYEL